MLAIIGGTGLCEFEDLCEVREERVVTPYGPPSGPLLLGRLGGRPVAFLARHGSRHTLPPHAINYRANLWALREVGVDAIVAVAAVGGIAPEPAPGELAVPDQLIDYTWGREHTFCGGPGGRVEHVDFTAPYAARLRKALLEAGARAGQTLADGGCYAATQGPRLETAAEIDRLERDGCTLVGMTGMPEAVLARELGIEYACLAVIVNAAAGRAPGPISGEAIRGQLGTGMARVRALIGALATGEPGPAAG